MTISRYASPRVLTAAVIVFAAGAVSASPHSGQPDQGNPFIEINRLAATSKTDQTAIRGLVDRILDTFSPFEIPQNHSLRGRLLKAEADFRKGKHPSVTESQVVAAVNDQISFLGGPECVPDWVRMTSGQINAFRTALKSTLPQIIGTSAGVRGRFAPGPSMSPVEASLVVLYLSRAKVFDNTYQVSPEVWVAGLRSRKEARATAIRDARKSSTAMKYQSGSAKVFGSVLDPDIGSFLNAVEVNLRDETSVASRQAHRLLDVMGIGR